MNPGNWDGDGKDTLLGRQEAKAVWDGLHTNFCDEANMNGALVTMLLALLARATAQSFQKLLLANPNMVAGRVFQWFFEIYGHSNETDRLENRIRMEADWSFDDSVKTLINQINTRLRYATYKRNPMNNQ